MVNQRYEYSVGVLPLPSAVSYLRSALGQSRCWLCLWAGGGKPAKLVSKSPIPSAEGLAVYKTSSAVLRHYHGTAHNRLYVAGGGRSG